jgi:hypothetical protein
MDRQDAHRVPLADDFSATATGWDSHAVWRERVQRPRQGASPRSTAPADASLLDTASGWDPLETWRIRVKRPVSATR